MKIIIFFLLFFVSIFTGFSLAQIPNSGFENWEIDPDGNNNPVGWQTTNSTPIITVEPYSPGCQGSYAMKVKTINAGFALSGVATLMTAFNFSQRSAKFFACIKSNIMTGDQAFIILGLMKGDSIVAAMDSCTFKIDSTISQFTTIEFPISYLSNLIPDSLILIVASGLANGQVGTELIVDEIGFSGGSTNISDDINLPQNFDLHQNYPNPFNPDTKIKYSIPASSFISLKIYDVLGNEIAVLVNEEKDRGVYTVNFNASQFASGLYLYRLQADNFVETKKMLLLK